MTWNLSAAQNSDLTGIFTNVDRFTKCNSAADATLNASYSRHAESKVGVDYSGITASHIKKHPLRL